MTSTEVEGLLSLHIIKKALITLKTKRVYERKNFLKRNTVWGTYEYMIYH
jgi:hypothetical protein